MLWLLYNLPLLFNVWQMSGSFVVLILSTITV
jgi:hypothetical protein